jgi:hypothetical protein
MDSQLSYKDTQIDLTIGQAILKRGEAWISENAEEQRFLTPQENLYKEDSPGQEPEFDFEFTEMSDSPT